MWKRFQKVLPSHPGRHGGGLMSTGASQSPPQIVPESSESARDVIVLQPARAVPAPSDRLRGLPLRGRKVGVVDIGTEFGRQSCKAAGCAIAN
jgi:hypothetical protein